MLDIGLPDADGRDVCQALRANGCAAGVVFLTARHHTATTKTATGVILTGLVLAGCSSTSSRATAPTTSTCMGTSPRVAASLTPTLPSQAGPRSELGGFAGTGSMLAGMPPPLQADDVWAADRAGQLSPAVRGMPTRVYVPNSSGNTVTVIDPATFKVLKTVPAARREPGSGPVSLGGITLVAVLVAYFAIRRPDVQPTFESPDKIG